MIAGKPRGKLGESLPVGSGHADVRLRRCAPAAAWGGSGLGLSAEASHSQKGVFLWSLPIKIDFAVFI